jgi:hypothetical protein
VPLVVDGHEFNTISRMKAKREIYFVRVPFVGKADAVSREYSIRQIDVGNVAWTDQSALVPPPSTLIEPLPPVPPSSLLLPAAADAKLDGNCEGIMKSLAGYTHLGNETGVMVENVLSKALHLC